MWEKAPPIEARPNYLPLDERGLYASVTFATAVAQSRRKSFASVTLETAEVPIHFLLATLLGKAAAGAASKGLAAKASAAGAKSASGHHGHRHLARNIADKVVDKVRDDVVDRVAERADAKRAQRKGALTE